MKLSSFFPSFFALVALISSIESRKVRPTNVPIELFTTKELDSNHLIRNILVVSGIAFSETRFKKESESQVKLFEDISKAGYLTPSLPMISDTGKGVRYISTDEAVINYIILSYNKQLISKNLLEYAISSQLSAISRNYMKRVASALDSSKSLVCTALLKMENIHHALKVLDDAYNTTKYKFLYGDAITYIDLTVYTLALFIENVSSGCVMSNFHGIRKAAMNISNIPQIYSFENSSYFLSLLVPGTHTFAKRINFSHSTQKFSSLAS
ncbi:glutathione S-transferase-like and signal peptide-containing protein [Cryptosporidium canis]|nr:glutathione S-transferase-like and signal peptide-containing protein [Cryptosporidium canis]